MSMPVFPRFTRLTTIDYELFPGVEGDGRFDVVFDEGPWVILGVNGIGKSTLLLLLKHLLVGPLESREPGFAGQNTTDRRKTDSAMFASRVEDRARESSGIVECAFGNHRVTVERSLHDLSLSEAVFRRGNTTSRITEETELQAEIAHLMGVARFDDVLKLTDLVVFRIDQSENFLWNIASQREVFSALLMPEVSKQMRVLEGRIVSADSGARNINASLVRETRNLNREVARENVKTSLQAQLTVLKAELETLEELVQSLLADIDKAGEGRLDARLYVKRAEQDVANASERYETLKLKALRGAFAELDQNTTYQLLKIIADKRCPACGSNAESAASELEDRQANERCILCNNELVKESKKVTSLSSRLQSQLNKAFDQLRAAQVELESVEIVLREAEETWKSSNERLDEATSNMDEVTRKLIAFEKKLPRSDRLTRRQKEQDINAFRALVNELRRSRKKAEGEYKKYVSDLKTAVEKVRIKLEKTFSRRSTPFFGDQARLVYMPRSSRVGLMGEEFEFPAFEIEMDAGPGHGSFVRRDADAVSRSQREYLDVIFRMSVLETIGANSGGSFIFDGPEGSVDAVFGERAGMLFSDFSAIENFSVIIACNVVEGGLIPHTIKRFRNLRTKTARLVNLLDCGRPTSTLERLRSEYESKIALILTYSTLKT